MALPQSIQAQLDAADALLAQANSPEPKAPEASTVEAPPVAAPVPSPTPVAPPVAAPQPPAENWEHKYKTLQGLFNQRVPDLQTQVQTLQQQVRELVARSEKPAETVKPPEPPATDPKDVERFGEDLVEMVERVVDRRFNAVSRLVETQFGNLTTKVAEVERVLTGTTQTVAVTAEEAFFTKLASAMPEWEQQNMDPAFLAWLAEVDPMLGQPRQVALQAAQQSWDAPRVIAIFRAFAPHAPTPPAPPAVDPLEKQLTPRDSATSAPTPPAEKPFVTQKQIVQFYDDLAKGRYRGREQEAANLENSINAALAEGRVR